MATISFKIIILMAICLCIDASNEVKVLKNVKREVNFVEEETKFDDASKQLNRLDPLKDHSKDNNLQNLTKSYFSKTDNLNDENMLIHQIDDDHPTNSMSQVEIMETPVKSEGDKKDYRLIKLQNGLKVLLIKTHTDADSKESDVNHAAAALLVLIGKIHEPREIGGLAHFLEHMIFMGSEKFPEENGLNNFVKANGGHRNGATSHDSTIYLFDAFEKVLPEGLSRLADMLIAPLLPKNAMQREREAVDSEFKMKMSKEGRRILAIMRTMFQDSHPASRFSSGNLRTLRDEISDDDLHKALVKFYEHKYVANKMFLCVQSKRPLNELQAMVVEKFSAIRSENDEKSAIRSEFYLEKFVKPEFYEKIFYVKPRVVKKSLFLTWVLPPQIENYKCKPLKHVEKIFNNDGDGGISKWLKEKNLALTFDIGSANKGLFFNHEFSIMQLEVGLTEIGLQNIETILSAIYSYLLLLKETPVEEHKRLFEQNQRQLETSWKFYQEAKPLSIVKSISEKFMYFDDIDILRTSLTPNFDKNAILDVINRMNEMNFNLMVVSDAYGNFTMNETYTGTEYDYLSVPDSYKILWNTRKLNADFFLTEPNPFEATDFHIKVNDEESTIHPVKILDNQSFEVWHKLDKKFKLPKANIEVALIAPEHLSSIENFLQMRIFSKMFSHHTHKKLSQAYTAKLNGDLSVARNGVHLSFYGYNDKLELFIELFLQELKNVQEVVKKSLFEQFREKKKKSLLSALKNIRSLGDDYLRKLLVNNHHLDYDMYKLIEQVSCEQVQQIQPKVLEKLKFKILAQGNIDRNETLKVVQLLESNFNYQPHDQKLELKKRGYQLPLGFNIMRIKSLLPNDDNSLIKNFYQIGLRNSKTLNMAKMFSEFVRPKAFDYLRTQHQLGYSTKCELESFGGVIGLSVYVISQEHKHNFTEVQTRITEFMQNIITNAVNELMDEDFEKLRETRINQLHTEIISLHKEVAINWDEIDDGFYRFDRREIYANVTKQITKAEFQEFYHSFMDDDNQRTVGIQIIGSKSENASITNNDDNLKVEMMSEKFTPHNVITDIESFQHNLYLYPILMDIE